MMRRDIYIWLMTIWLLIGGESPVWAYKPATLPSAWRSTPALSTDVQPNYQFRSTSSFTPIVGQTSYTSTTSFTPVGQYRPGSIRRGIDDEEPEDPTDPEIGVVDTPVGEPMILLLLALLFIGYKIAKFRYKNTQKQQIIAKKFV